MKGRQRTYHFFQFVSAVFMIMALLWVTVSIYFVTSVQQELARQNKIESDKSPLTCNEKEAASPSGSGSATEENAPCNTSISEEYLHESFIVDHFFSAVTYYYKCENADTYIAFYGELLAPPPNAA